MTDIDQPTQTRSVDHVRVRVYDYQPVSESRYTPLQADYVQAQVLAEHLMGLACEGDVGALIDARSIVMTYYADRLANGWRPTAPVHDGRADRIPGIPTGTVLEIDSPEFGPAQRGTVQADWTFLDANGKTWNSPQAWHKGVTYRYFPRRWRVVQAVEA